MTYPTARAVATNMIARNCHGGSNSQSNASEAQNARPKTTTTAARPSLHTYPRILARSPVSSAAIRGASGDGCNSTDIRLSLVLCLLSLSHNRGPYETCDVHANLHSRLSVHSKHRQPAIKPNSQCINCSSQTRSF